MITSNPIMIISLFLTSSTVYGLTHHRTNIHNNNNNILLQPDTSILRVLSSTRSKIQQCDRQINNKRFPVSSSPTARFVSYSVDGVGFPFPSSPEDELWKLKQQQQRTYEDDVVGEEIAAEEATENEIKLRKQRLLNRGNGITCISTTTYSSGPYYVVELPLFQDVVTKTTSVTATSQEQQPVTFTSTFLKSKQQQQAQQGGAVREKVPFGLAFGQMLPGRVLSSYELDLDTLETQSIATPAEANAEDSDTRPLRKRERVRYTQQQKQSNNEATGLFLLDETMFPSTVGSGLIVTSVVVNGTAWVAGIRPGDIVTGVSATIGDKIWPKSTLDGVRSAVLSRRISSSANTGTNSIQFQFQTLVSAATATGNAETKLSSRDSTNTAVVVNNAGISSSSTKIVKKEGQYELTLSRPLGFKIRESLDGSGYVEVSSIGPDASNLVKYGVQVGDRIIAIGSSIGDQLWPASSTVEGVISACTGRLPGQPVTIRFERPIIMEPSTTEQDQQQLVSQSFSSTASTSTTVIKSTTASTIPNVAPNTEELKARCREVLKRYTIDETTLKLRQKNKSIEGFQALVADKVVDALASASAQLDAYTLNMIMNAYLSGGKPKKALQIFEAATGFAADGSVLSVPTVIQGKTPGSRIVPAESSLNLFTGTTLLRAHSGRNDLAAVQCVLAALSGESGTIIDEQLETAPWPWTGVFGSIQPDTICYNVAIAAAEKVGSDDALEFALDLFHNQMRNPPSLSELKKSGRIIQQQQQQSSAIQKPVRNQITYNSLISALCNANRSTEAFTLFEQMKSVGLRPDKYTYTSLIKVCIHDGDITELLYDMKERGVAADVVTYNAIIKALCEKRRWTSATQVIIEMENNGIVPDATTYSLLMNEMIQDGKCLACLTLFETASQSSRTASVVTNNVYLYTIAISAAAKLGDHQRAIELLSRMKINGIQPNLQTITAVLGACMVAKQYDLAIQLFTKMEQPDSYALAQGIRAYCLNGNIVEASSLLLRESPKLTGKQIMYTYNHFFRAALKSYNRQLDDNEDTTPSLFKNMEIARIVFADMLRKGYLPNKEIYVTFQECFQLSSSIPVSNARRFRIVQPLDEQLAQFKFLLFIMDTLNQQNIVVESILYVSALTLAHRIGGLPRRLCSMMANIRQTTEKYQSVPVASGLEDGTKTIENQSSIESFDKNSFPKYEKWEELLNAYMYQKDSINTPLRKMMMIPVECYPSVLNVRVSPRDVRPVLKAETAVTAVSSGITTSNRYRSTKRSTLNNSN